MTSLLSLADAVLPLIRSNSRELYRYRAATAHGWQMSQAVTILEAAIDSPTTLPGEFEVAVPSAAEVYQVTHKALASAITVIARADDSAGVIGGVCQELTELHPRAAAAAKPPAQKLADWVFEFHFDERVDYFQLDPVAYAPALGETGMARLRAHVETLRVRVLADSDASKSSHDSFLLGWFDQRFAVLDKDVDAIVRTHLRDGKVAAWFEQTARAMEEIERADLAIEWAERGMMFGLGHQSIRCGEYWWKLIAANSPERLPDAAWTRFRRWPGSDTAARLERTVGAGARSEIILALQDKPSELVHYLIDTVDDVQAAWEAAHRLKLDNLGTWTHLAKAYEQTDPLAAVSVHLSLVDASLEHANTRAYRPAARELVRLRKLAAKAGDTTIVDQAVASLREQYRRRPSLIDALDAARLP